MRRRALAAATKLRDDSAHALAHAHTCTRPRRSRRGFKLMSRPSASHNTVATRPSSNSSSSSRTAAPLRSYPHTHADPTPPRLLQVIAIAPAVIQPALQIEYPKAVLHPSHPHSEIQTHTNTYTTIVTSRQSTLPAKFIFTIKCVLFERVLRRRRRRRRSGPAARTAPKQIDDIRDRTTAESKSKSTWSIDQRGRGPRPITPNATIAVEVYVSVRVSETVYAWPN